MFPKVDFAGNIYKILNEAGKNGADVNLVTFFLVPLESSCHKSWMKPSIRLGILIFNAVFSIFLKVNDPDGVRAKQPDLSSVSYLSNESPIFISNSKAAILSTHNWIPPSSPLWESIMGGC